MIILAVSFIVFNVWIFFIADIFFSASVSAVSLLVLLFLYFETGKFGWSYSIDSNGIFIKRTFKKYNIFFRDIDSVKEISRNRAAELVNKAGSKGPNSGGGLKPGVNLGRLIGFCSVPVTGSSAKDLYINGSKERIYADKFVFVRKSSGSSYILSPYDTGGFVRECKKYTAK